MRELTTIQQSYYNVLESEGKVERERFGLIFLYSVKLNDGSTFRIPEYDLPVLLDSMMEVYDGQGHSL